MVSFTTNSSHFLVSPSSLTYLNARNFGPFFCLVNRRTRVNKQVKIADLSLVGRKERGSFLGFLGVKKKDSRDSCWRCGGFVRRCVKGWDCEENTELEAEILEFMKNSEKPEVFPSKKDLMDAGRMDLVEAIMRQRGWLALGWDLDNEEEEKGWVQENGTKDWDWITLKEFENGASQINNKAWSSGVSDFAVNSSSAVASSSGRSLEAAAEEDYGVEGILCRLEKERNMNLGVSWRKKTNTDHSLSSTGKNDSLAGPSCDSTVGDLQRSIRPVSLNLHRGITNDSVSKIYENKSRLGTDGSMSSLKPEMWRTWSMNRAGSSCIDFEAAEIASNEMHNIKDVVRDERLDSGECLNRREESNSYDEELNHNRVQARLRHLKFELSSVLQSLRSTAGIVVPVKENESSSDDMQKLSDAWEFQQTEIMNAQDTLRSIRAKLAVLEGKMALSIIDAQRVVEEKQKRIDDAGRALRLLRTACIVWPNSASEVLLAGSFDGWATQRNMDKSRTGIFSLSLKLYPGRYEIKFIVDGEWKIDPLRPIVRNNGYENNLLIIT